MPCSVQKQIYASPGTVIWRELLQPLSKAPALEYVCLYGSIATQSISNTPLNHDDGATVLGAISCNPHVKMIHIPKANPHIAVSTLQIRTDGALEKLFIGSGRECASCFYTKRILANAYLRSMVSMVDYPYDVIKEDPGPLPVLSDKIWEHILMQATEECAYSARGLGKEGGLRVLNKPVNRTRKSILLVSKRFYVRAIISGRFLSKLTDMHTPAVGPPLHVWHPALPAELPRGGIVCYGIHATDLLF